jgi:hypothetical protein
MIFKLSIIAIVNAIAKPTRRKDEAFLLRQTTKKIRKSVGHKIK